MTDPNLKSAIDALRAAEKSLAEQIRALTNKRQAIQESIESLSQLAADSVVENPVFSPPSVRPAPVDLSRELADRAPLWQLLHALLRVQPQSTNELAQALLASGYQTTSANFQNVIVTTLGTRKDVFERGIDGRWYIRETPEAQVADLVGEDPRPV